jgi:TonB family protein
MEFIVTPDGRVARVRIVDGRPLIGEAAVTAVKQWVFEPAKRKGKAVPFAMLYTLRFRLN